MHLSLQKILLICLLTFLAVSAFLQTSTLLNYLSSCFSTLRSPSGEFVGGDFIAFYLGASLYSYGSEILYNLSLQKLWLESFSQSLQIPIGFLPYVYPPAVAWFFSLFAQLSLPQAYGIWLVASSTLLLTSFFLLAKLHSWSLAEKLFALLIFFSFSPFMSSLFPAGQLTSFVRTFLSLPVFALSFPFINHTSFLVLPYCFSASLGRDSYLASFSVFLFFSSLKSFS
jgi:hypothetical protein